VASCEIDWKLTFEGFSTFLEPIADASWPIALVGALFLFRTEISGLFLRIKKIRGVGVEAELEADQQGNSTPSAPPLPAFGTEFPPPHEVWDDFDSFLRNVLDNEVGGSVEKRLAWAIRVRSVTETNRLHERHLRLIFASQVKALRALNFQGRAPAADFERFFEEAKADPDFATVHEHRTFEEWGRFLLQTGYVKEVPNTVTIQVEITPFGRQFLTWMTEQRVPEVRFG